MVSVMDRLKYITIVKLALKDQPKSRFKKKSASGVVCV